MTEEKSLLAHLAFKVTGKHEVIATEGLAFILRQSRDARAALRSLLLPFAPSLPEELRYESESVGEDRERPDVVGLDAANRPRAVIEGKFWAGLTRSQSSELFRAAPGS